MVGDKIDEFYEEEAPVMPEFKDSGEPLGYGMNTEHDYSCRNANSREVLPLSHPLSQVKTYNNQLGPQGLDCPSGFGGDMQGAIF